MRRARNAVIRTHACDGFSGLLPSYGNTLSRFCARPTAHHLSLPSVMFSDEHPKNPSFAYGFNTCAIQNTEKYRYFF